VDGVVCQGGNRGRGKTRGERGGDGVPGGLAAPRGGEHEAEEAGAAGGPSEMGAAAFFGFLRAGSSGVSAAAAAVQEGRGEEPLT